MNVALKYLTVLAALGGGLYAIYAKSPYAGAGLIFFAGLLCDYEPVTNFAQNVGVSLLKAWKGSE